MSAPPNITEQSQADRSTEPVPKRWSRAEYYRLAELGLFEREKTELIGGEIVVLNPQKHAHYVTIDKVGELMARVFGKGYWIRTQAPLTCGTGSEPEPDVSVVQGSRDDYTDHPTAALLVVEVSDTTLDYDRNDKMSLYARSGIPEYWIVNLVDRSVDVHRNPIPDNEKSFGFAYSTVRTLQAGEKVGPLEKPDGEIAVSDMLP